MYIGQKVHFSVDGVIESFKWIYQNRPKSIFDVPMLDMLRKWHNQYGIGCDLYVYEVTDDFKFTDLQEEYCKELGKESNWLKIAWYRRKAGPLSDSTSVEIESLNRVYKFVTECISPNAWSRFVRLHRWQADKELLKYLAIRKIDYLLTADSDKLSSDLNQDEYDKLKKYGSYQKNTFSYIETDIRFDYFAENMSVQECLDKTQILLNTKNSKNRIEVFCHENVFEKISSQIEEYWNGLSRLKMPLFMNASVLIQDWIYFTVCNLNTLLRRNIKTGEIQNVIDLPCKTNNRMKFVSLVYCEGNIWMIPWAEEKIYIYDLDRTEITVLPIPYEPEEKGIAQKFRRAVQRGRYLWLIPPKTPVLIRIDMPERTFKLYDEWPLEISFLREQKMNFISMWSWNEKLFLLPYGASHGVCVDMQSGHMTIWGINIWKEYGLIKDGQLWIVPTYSGDAIQCYNMDGLVKQYEQHLPDGIAENENGYAFWNPEIMHDDLLFLPHEANAIVYQQRKQFFTIKIKKEDYLTLRERKNFAGYEAFASKTGILITSFMGNKIVELDKQGGLLGEHILEIALSDVLTHKNTISDEDYKGDLERYIKNMVAVSDQQWNVEKGETIL